MECGFVALLIQEVHSLFPVTTRHFHADMHLVCVPLRQPSGQFLQPFGVVTDVTLVGLSAIQEGGIKALFGNIDAENLLSHVLSLPYFIGTRICHRTALFMQTHFSVTIRRA